MQESLEASLVRIHTVDGGVVGAGFLVGERHILTCAHVVARALGLTGDTPEKPQVPVSLDVPRVAPGQLLTARIALWRPPQADGGDDIAGLELLDNPPHGAQAAPLAQVDDLWEHSFRAFGFPRGQDTGVWATGRLLGRNSTNWVQIEDVKETGFAVEPGFSGTPVWDPQVEAVVGMVVAAEKRMNLKTAFAIPVDVLARSWPLLESLIHPFVFLCYARADSDLVTRLKTDLLERRIQVWIDREGLQPGTLDWEDALRTAIRAARAVLLIASPHARSSRYVKDELRIAEMYLRPVYPLWIAGTQWIDAVPLGWGGAQYLDARESRYEAAIPELVALLNKASSTSTTAPELDFEPRNPYKGLRAFTGDDAQDFFGRDTLIKALVATLDEALTSEEKHQPCARLLAVVGPSGSGKSSVVMAGLLPRLREGRLPGSEQWVYLDPMVPGARPIEALTLALSEHLPDKSLKAIREDLEDDAARGLHLLATRLAKRPGTKVVLLVDQFEELFTQTPSEDERRHFLDLLVTATTEPHGQVIVLLTLRADFYDRPMRYPLLQQLIQVHQTNVLPMSIHELREVIEKPAALPDVQLTFAGDLVGDLLFEVQGQVGALPLLQFALDQLFSRRSGRQLTLSAYRELGGVKGALTRQAEETYAALPSDEHRKLARALFLRLIDPGATEQDTTRRRAALSEFSLQEASQMRLLQETIDAFIKVRLLTTNEIAGTTTIEVSHEALIREWPRLAGWLREAREDIPLQQTISRDAAEWERRYRPDDRLYRGSQLKEAQAWARRNTPSGNEVAFLRAGAERRIRIVASWMVVVLLLSTIGIAATWFLSPLLVDPTHVTTLKDDVAGSLRWCIDNAPSGSTISFAQDMRGTIVLTAGDLTFAGGKELIIAGPGANQLTISGGDIGSTIRVSRHALVIISGLNFKNSKTSIDAFLYNQGMLTVTNSVISGNKTTATATSYGGGIENTGTLTVISSTISNNSSSARDQNGQGGGIFNEGTLTVTHSTFSYNSASSSGSGNYGGIGGGIYNTGTLMVANSSFSANSANSSGSRSSYGGGIANDGKLTVTNSTFSYNTANSGNSSLGGGIVNSWIGTLMVTTSTFSDNSASGKQNAQGGGIANDGGKLTVVNSSFVNNTASAGGGISSSGTKGSSAIIHFCTFYRNTSSVGGGIWVDPKGGRHLTISGSIIAANSALRGPDISGVLTSDGYNLIENVAGAIGLIASTDRLVTLAGLKIDSLLGNNGGSIQTLALLRGSPAIDAVPLQTCRITVTDPFGQNLTITTDQRGMKRPDGNESACDIGAYEYQDTPT